MKRATILLASRGDANKETTKGASTVAWHRSFSSSSLKKIFDQVRGFRCRIHSSPDFLPRSCPCVASSHFCLDNLSPIVTLSSTPSSPSSDPDHNYPSETLECRNQIIQHLTEKAIVRSINPRNSRRPSSPRPTVRCFRPGRLPSPEVVKDLPNN